MKSASALSFVIAVVVLLAVSILTVIIVRNLMRPLESTDID
jgi:competence protein ComGC